MFMHIRSKEMAFLGMMTACFAIFVFLGSIVESSTLFFLSAASFLTGIGVREYGIRTGGVFFLASALVSFFVGPNKLYCMTCTLLSFYIYLREFLFDKIEEKGNYLKKRKLFLLIKWILFNVCYIPLLLFFPFLFSFGEKGKAWPWLVFMIGQFGFFVYDKAYDYFQSFVWERWRKHFPLK